MIEEIIADIVLAEQKASDMNKQASAQAKAIIFEAQEQANIIIENSKKIVSESISNANANASVEATKRANENEKEVKKTIESYQQRAAKNSKKAIDFIIKSLEV